MSSPGLALRFLTRIYRKCPCLLLSLSRQIYGTVSGDTTGRGGEGPWKPLPSPTPWLREKPSKLLALLGVNAWSLKSPVPPCALLSHSTCPSSLRKQNPRGHTLPASPDTFGCLFSAYETRCQSVPSVEWLQGLWRVHPSFPLLWSHPFPCSPSLTPMLTFLLPGHPVGTYHTSSAPRRG